MSSCGTVATLTKNVKYKASPYSGVKYDMYLSGMIGNAPVEKQEWWGATAFMDIPGSFILDTIVLPYTCIAWVRESSSQFNSVRITPGLNSSYLFLHK